MSASGSSRRTFLLAGGVAVAGGAIAWKLATWSRPGAPLADSASARRIGARFASRYPDAATALWQGRAPRNAAEWGPRLEQLRRADLEADRLVQVDGWWLAETELRLCVLLHATS